MEYQSLVNIDLVKLNSPADITEYVNTIHDNLLYTAKHSVPMKQIRLQGPKWKATPELRTLLEQSRNAHKEWAKLGKPGPDHPLSIEKKSFKRRIRALQRRQIYNEREQFYNRLCNSKLIYWIL